MPYSDVGKPMLRINPPWPPFPPPLPLGVARVLQMLALPESASGIRDQHFFGDSQLVGILGAKPFRRSLHPSSEAHGVWGKSLAEFVAELEENPPSSIRRSRAVNLFFGGNDISAGDSAEAIIERYRQALTKVRALAPNATIRIADIPWRWDALENPPEWLEALRKRTGWTACERQATLEVVNAWIADECGEFERIPLNDWIETHNEAVRCSSPSVSDNDVDPAFKKPEPDVHLSKRGYLHVGTELARWLMPR